MTKDYGRQAIGKKHKLPQQYWKWVLCFVLGFLAASLFKMDGINRWLNAQLLAFQETKRSESKPLEKQAPEKLKPKFEFYTLLTNEEEKAHLAASKTLTEPLEKPQSQEAAAVKVSSVNTSKQEAAKLNHVEAAKAASVEPLNKARPLSKEKGAYLVQMASFKARKDAEQMKALFTLKGYDVNVVEVNHSGGRWFRVLIGPYANRLLAQRAQLTISKSEHLNGMVRSAGG